MLTRVLTLRSTINRCSKLLSTLKFAPSHEYIKFDGTTGTIGITDHAAAALGDIVYVDLPAVGNSYKAGESFGSVESVKAASDVYSPVSGEVIEVNKVNKFLLSYLNMIGLFKSDLTVMMPLILLNLLCIFII